MPSPLAAYTLDHQPFPSQMRSAADGEGIPAFPILESFAKEETVVLVEARPHWEYGDGGAPTDAVFDVVAAYPSDPELTNPATSLGSVRVPHGTSRRFLMGIPGGHKLVVHPADQGRGGQIVGAAADSFMKVTLVDYWA